MIEKENLQLVNLPIRTYMLQEDICMPLFGLSAATAALLHGCEGNAQVMIPGCSARKPSARPRTGTRSVRLTWSATIFYQD